LAAVISITLIRHSGGISISPRRFTCPKAETAASEVLHLHRDLGIDQVIRFSKRLSSTDLHRWVDT
jgi:hypothetical protein